MKRGASVIAFLALLGAPALLRPTLAGRLERLQLVLVPLDLPPASGLGTYRGPTRMALGEIKDRGFAEGPDSLGPGPVPQSKIELDRSRVEAVSTGVTHLLSAIGMLAATPEEATYLLDVEILRNRLTTFRTGSRGRLRGEVFLEFTFRHAGSVAGRVLACGNAEMYWQKVKEEQIVETYQAGFNDALFKLIASRTFGRLAGSEWNPAAPTEGAGKQAIHRIQKDRFYGPSDYIRGRTERALGVIGPRSAGRLVLRDFEILRPDAGEAAGDQGAADDRLPKLLAEHLNAFYPGAFGTIERQGGAGGTGDVLVRGHEPKFETGDTHRRGATQGPLDIIVRLEEGGTGKEIYTLDLLPAPYGYSAMQVRFGLYAEYMEQVSRDLAYFLVRTLAPAYRPPHDLEICFDGTPYPGSPA